MSEVIFTFFLAISLFTASALFFKMLFKQSSRRFNLLKSVEYSSSALRVERVYKVTVLIGLSFGSLIISLTLFGKIFLPIF